MGICSYRIWNEATRHMEDVVSIVLGKDNLLASVVAHDSANSEDILYHDIPSYYLMQYTGAHDIHGTCIFEDDYVKGKVLDELVEGVVHYDLSLCEFMLMRGSDGHVPMSVTTFMEVQGNIHESRALLESSRKNR